MLAQNIVSLTCFFDQEGCDLSHFQSFINKKSLLKRINSTAKKFENTPILPNFNTDPFLTSKLILEGSYAFFFFYNEYISFRMKEIYKMSILEEIIRILVLK